LSQTVLYIGTLQLFKCKGVVLYLVAAQYVLYVGLYFTHSTVVFLSDESRKESDSENESEVGHEEKEQSSDEES
jgi:hypothetical protein